MLDEVELVTETGADYPARLRPGTAEDIRALIRTWVPILERGPESWLDREWDWPALGVADLHVELNPEWLVIVDELGAGPSREILGVLVTTGPVTAPASRRRSPAGGSRRIGEDSAIEDRAAQVRLAKVSTTEVRAAEVCVIEVRADEVHLGEARVTEVGCAGEETRRAITRPSRNGGEALRPWEGRRPSLALAARRGG
jgi:hypothetical protein